MKSKANVMETVDQAIQPVQAAARTAAKAGSREFRNLIAGVEDLIKRVTTARSTAENTDEYVRSKPWSAIGIAAGSSLRSPCC